MIVVGFHLGGFQKHTCCFPGACYWRYTVLPSFSEHVCQRNKCVFSFLWRIIPTDPVKSRAEGGLLRMSAWPGSFRSTITDRQGQDGSQWANTCHVSSSRVPADEQRSRGASWSAELCYPWVVTGWFLSRFWRQACNIKEGAQPKHTGEHRSCPQHISSLWDKWNKAGWWRSYRDMKMFSRDKLDWGQAKVFIWESMLELFCLKTGKITVEFYSHWCTWVRGCDAAVVVGLTG